MTRDGDPASRRTRIDTQRAWSSSRDLDQDQHDAAARLGPRGLRLWRRPSAIVAGFAQLVRFLSITCRRLALDPSTGTMGMSSCLCVWFDPKGVARADFPDRRGELRGISRLAGSVSFASAAKQDRLRPFGNGRHHWPCEHNSVSFMAFTESSTILRHFALIQARRASRSVLVTLTRRRSKRQAEYFI